MFRDYVAGKGIAVVNLESLFSGNILSVFK